MKFRSFWDLCTLLAFKFALFRSIFSTLICLCGPPTCFIHYKHFCKSNLGLGKLTNNLLEAILMKICVICAPYTPSHYFINFKLFETKILTNSFIIMKQRAHGFWLFVRNMVVRNTCRFFIGQTNLFNWQVGTMHSVRLLTSRYIWLH